MTELCLLSELDHIHDALVGNCTSLDAHREYFVAFDEISLGNMTSCSVEVTQA